MKITVTADDLGISPGVNAGIIEAHQKGRLDRASLLANSEYFDQAVILIKNQTPGLKLGVHLNLTYGKCVSRELPAGILVNKNSFFRCSYVKLLMLSLGPWQKKLYYQARLEFEAQFNKIQNHKINISHIDSHHHIHTIPLFRKIVYELAKKYGIKEVRVINENIFTTYFLTKSIFLFDIKHVLFFCLNKIFHYFYKIDKSKYFVSILYSCRLKEEYLRNIQALSKYQFVEIMLHPGNPDMDKKMQISIGKETNHIYSPYREQEKKTACFLKNQLKISH